MRIELDRVEKFRETLGISLQEAKHLAIKEQVERTLSNKPDNELTEVLKVIAKNVFFKEI